MSALVRNYREINSSIDQNIDNINSQHCDVTSISVTARIDYVLRFSKQLVLVVDDNAQLTSKIASQFLGTLTNQQASTSQNTSQVNAAFVSASTKLNDIQMRCRFIEQLFSNTLFDPEQSLVISILRLAKTQFESITIVVENAHSLSLQLKYELCQLVEVAKKTSQKINVVLFANNQATQQIANNKTVFVNKLSIISAQSGQLIGLNSINIARSKKLFSLISWKKITLLTTIILPLLVLTVFAITQRDNFDMATLPDLFVINKAPLNDNERQLTTNVIKNEPPISQDIIANTNIIEQTKASANDINQALLGRVTLTNDFAVETAKNSIAEAEDILSALEINLAKLEKVSHFAQGLLLPVALTPAYYFSKQQGYVVQLIGFSDVSMLEKFVQNMNEFEYFSYQRILNEKSFYVLTSPIYETKVQANEYVSSLPQDVQQSGLWIKSLSAVKNEINSFNVLQ